jgi:fengycin family lipopeptide synthetase D
MPAMSDMTDMSERELVARWAVVAQLVSTDPSVVVELTEADRVSRYAAEIAPSATLSEVARALQETDAPPDLRVLLQGEEVLRLEAGDLPQELLLGLHRRVARALADPGVTVQELDLLEEGEPWACVSGPEVPYDRQATLWSQLVQTARHSPGAVAVRSRDGDLSYAELVARARGVAVRLRELGIHRGDRVGVAAVRTLALPVALYGILAAGAAYVPLDPSMPPARLREMADRAGVRLLLGGTLAALGLPTLDPLALPPADELPLAELTLAEQPRPDDLCYVIFTSGSTGRPKGVMVTHTSVVNRLAWMQRLYPLDPSSVILQKTPSVFDVSVWELFWWSSVGASMALLPPGQEVWPEAIASAITRWQITELHFIPSLLHLFLEHLRARGGDLSSLRRVFSSGEALSSGTVRLFGAVLPQTPLTNLYGPTEATVDATSYDCPTHDPPERIPIGRPIDNLRAYVMRHGRPVPPGVAGRLHLGGVGVARGYVGAPELTAQVFVPEPGRPGEVMYDTGDLARWTEDGLLEFLGRRDLQIKIAGMRVELEEIEQIAREHPQVSECAVVARRPSANLLVLVAFLVTSAPADELRGWLRGRLPKHMLPSELRLLEVLPRTPTGKIDRQALSALAAAAEG